MENVIKKKKKKKKKKKGYITPMLFSCRRGEDGEKHPAAAVARRLGR